MVPIALDTIAPSGAKSFRLYLSVPQTVTKFAITECGGFNDVTGNAFTFSLESVGHSIRSDSRTFVFSCDVR